MRRRRHRAEPGWPYLLVLALAVTFAVVLLMSGKPAAEPSPTPSTCVPASTHPRRGRVAHLRADAVRRFDVEDTPIFREVAEAWAAGSYPVRRASPTAGRHHWRDDDRETTDPYGDVPEPRRWPHVAHR